ncbi:hypothetical protein B0H16DRAFT_219461 [Mycena metata]|uniref:Uncharacterized protein n=1 Tax=Mycena metata TaxID=1033252 RepID=A0AAD7JUL4_9AGAR|nr:hypothetical protein B0H16DRAFT_219461 [Mycena metata]
MQDDQRARAERISNSLLVQAIRWSTQGVRDESWTLWDENRFSLRDSPYFKFTQLAEHVKAITMFTLPKTQHGLFKRHFCGYRDAHSGSAGNATSDVGDDYFALRVIDFVASEMGAPTISWGPTTPWSFNLELRGRALEVMDLLKNWPEVIIAAKASGDNYKAQNTTRLAEAEAAILPGNPETLHKKALYNNCTRNFQKHRYELILRNFRLAALALGWYLSGNFDTSQQVVLKGLKERGFQKEIEAEETTLTAGMKNTKINLPFKLALFISPITLLLPKPLATWKFHEGQLIYIYKTLRDFECPEDLMTIEGLLFKELLKVSQGIKIAEKGLADFYTEAQAVTYKSNYWFPNLFSA